MTTELADTDAARRDVDELWHGNWEDNYQPEDRQSAEYAQAAINYLAQRRGETPGFIEAALQGAVDAAENLNSEPLHGIREVIQNADDVDAGKVSIMLRVRKGRQQLLFLHDGSPVGLRNVFSMMTAFVSTKAKDPRSIGKFGIGLKTLTTLGPRLEVHCRHYHFVVQDSSVSPIECEEAIPGFYDPRSGDTLFVLPLARRLDAGTVAAWLEGVGSSALLFLRSVRLVDFQSAKTQKIALALREKDSRRIELKMGSTSVECQQQTLHAPRSSHRWTRYLWECKVPPALTGKRSRKSTGITTYVGIAIDETKRDTGAVFAGLPTRIQLNGPISINAAFDPDTSREHLVQKGDWNPWLLEQVVRLLVAVARFRFTEDESTGWRSIPLQEELDGVAFADSWLHGRLTALLADETADLGSRVRLTTSAGVRRQLSTMAFEAVDLEGLLSESDVGVLAAPKAAMAHAARDGEGRWRRVMRDLALGHEVDLRTALRLFSLDDEQFGFRSPEWFLSFGALAIESSWRHEYARAKAFLLADGMTRSFCSVGDPSVHLVESIDPAYQGLATQLGVVNQIHPSFLARSDAATAVREHLRYVGGLSEQVEAPEVLRALGARPQKSIELSDSDLVELRDLLTMVSRDDRREYGPDAGSAVAVSGYVYQGGKKVKQPVCPADAYLPPAMDVKGGWATAAERTPGLQWVDPRYRDLLLSGENREKLGAQAVFSALGASSAPRIRKAVGEFRRYGQDAAMLSWSDERRSVDVYGQPIFAEATLGDSSCPDLVAVVEDIASMSPSEKRSERARAVAATIDKQWASQFEEHAYADAVAGPRLWRRKGRVRSQWLEHVVRTPWLTTSARPREPLAPIDAKLGSAANRAAFGDAQSWAKEIAPGELSQPVLMALGIADRPRLTDLLDELIALREGEKSTSGAVQWTRVASIYAAMSQLLSLPETERAADGVSESDLRKEFGRRRLIWADAKWHAPSAVFRGRALFGSDHVFVPSNPAYSKLLDVLGIEEPSAGECIEWLRTVAKTGRNPAEPGLEGLGDVYRRIAALLNETNAATRKRLKTLPLWNGSSWTTTRPVLFSDDERIFQGMRGAGAAVWSAPLPPTTLGELPDYLGVHIVASDEVTLAAVPSSAGAAGDAATSLYETAFAHFVAYLTAECPGPLDRLSEDELSSLQSARIAIWHDAKATVQVAGRQYKVEVDRYLDCRIPGAPVFVLSSEDLIGERSGLGQLIAEAMTNKHAEQRELALAWGEAWRKALDGRRVAEIARARERQDWASTDGTIDGLVLMDNGKKPRRKAKPTDEGGASSAPPPRTLHDVDGLALAKELPGRTTRRGVLLPQPPPTMKDAPSGGSTGSHAGGAAKKLYGETERETEGLQLLAKHLLAKHGRRISDQRAERGVGADAVSPDGYYYELKVHGRGLPSSVNMPKSEVLQALRQRDRYILVLIDGMEAGHTPRLTMIPDPLSVLDYTPNGSVSVSGYLEGGFDQFIYEPEMMGVDDESE